MLPSFHPAVLDWFTRTLGKPTPAQEKGWPVIAAGRHALLLAPTVARFRQAFRRVPGWDGRWSLLRTRPLAPETRRREWAAVALHRYGLLAREWFYHEDAGLSWREVFQHLERSEWRGELRRGHFVTGLTGMQFALPEAVERLRSAPSSGYLLLNACDPANPYGPQLSPGSDWPADATIRRRPANHVLLHKGVCVFYAEGRGARHWVRPGHEGALVAYQERRLV